MNNTKDLKPHKIQKNFTNKTNTNASTSKSNMINVGIINNTYQEFFKKAVSEII